MSNSIDIVRKYFDAAPKRDFDTVHQLFHEDFSYTGSDGKRQAGSDAAIAVIETFTSAFPDMKLDIQSIYGAGDDVVVTEFIARGTHQGELMGIAPTGRTMALPVCNVIEVRDGKIYAEREYFDGSHLMKQLGVSE